MWPAISHAIEVNGADTSNLIERRDQFSNDLSRLFDRIQDAFESLPEEHQKKCGYRGIAVDIVFKVDMARKEIILDRIYKYCEMDVHIFRELIKIFRKNFPEYDLCVPSLEGYQLAEEISRHLNSASIECIYLKGDDQEMLLMGDRIQGITFDGILEDTRQHYQERGGIEKKESETRCGGEISMYFRTEDEEVEVLWMQLRAPISRFE